MSRSDRQLRLATSLARCAAQRTSRARRTARHTSQARSLNGIALNGFTLIEVLVTMLILSILLPVLMEGISISLRAASSARHKTDAANLAEDELNQLISTAGWSGNPQGDFGADHPGYTWQVQSTDEDYGLSEIRLTVTWAEKGQPRQLTVATMAQTNPTLPGSTDSTTTSTGITGLP